MKSTAAVKTFTVRDLNRSSAAVLATAERDGEARIRRRDGGTFVLKPIAAPARATPDWKSFVKQRRDWLKTNFPEPTVWTKAQVDEFDRMIASDGRLL